MLPLDPLEKCVAAFARLPGVGRRSAERMALHLATRSKGLSEELLTALQELRAGVRLCSQCGALTLTGVDPCRICEDTGRESFLLCVVERPEDVLRLEESGAFHGRYHVLHGKLSPLRGEGRGDMRLAGLLRRIETGRVSEILLALNADVESDATASFLSEMLAERPLKITRLALGLPAGGGLAYTDSITLSRAIQGRQRLGQE